jgi:uncharacterized protein YcbK (DUF882 family)
VRPLFVALLLFATVASSRAFAVEQQTNAARSMAPRKSRGPITLPPVELYALNTHESFVLKPTPAGTLPPKLRRAFSRFLRCHHTGRVHAMAPRLAELLYKVSRHFDGKRILVVAGYRAPKVAKQKGNPRSPHKQGLACDFRVDGVPSTELRDFVRSAFHGVGVGWYPNSDFVHLDVGRKRDAFWIDYSGPGERARYSRDPLADLAAEREGPTTDTNPEEGGEDPQGASSPGAAAPNLPALDSVTP